MARFARTPERAGRCSAGARDGPARQGRVQRIGREVFKPVDEPAHERERLAVLLAHPLGLIARLHEVCDGVAVGRQPRGAQHDRADPRPRGEVTQLLGEYRDTYAIDVSSPGPDRPVRTPAHFRAVTGQSVQVRTASEIAGKKRFRGQVVAASDRSLRLAAGEQELEIPYESIVRANLICEG